MEQEMETISNNQTWSFMDLPLGKRPIITKWVLKIKLRIKGGKYILNACLVVRGFEQGINFQKTFAIVIKWSRIWSIIVITTYEDLGKAHTWMSKQYFWMEN
jgi:hypothetical protein